MFVKIRKVVLEFIKIYRHTLPFIANIYDFDEVLSIFDLQTLIKKKL